MLALLVMMGLAVAANLFVSRADTLQNRGGPVADVPLPCVKAGSCPVQDVAAERGEPLSAGVTLRIDGRSQRFAGLTVNPDHGRWAVRVQLGVRFEPPSAGRHKVVASDGVETFDGLATVDVVDEHQGTVLYITAP